MLQDYVRTGYTLCSSGPHFVWEFFLYVLPWSDKLANIVSGTYHAAVLENRADFIGRVVVDVGAGSGILSLFAAQVS